MGAFAARGAVLPTAEDEEAGEASVKGTSISAPVRAADVEEVEELNSRKSSKYVELAWYMALIFLFSETMDAGWLNVTFPPHYYKFKINILLINSLCLFI